MNHLTNSTAFTYEYIIINEVPIRIGIREHLNRTEIEAFSNKKFQYNFIESPLEYYINCKNLSNSKKSYAFILAFTRRIDLPLELALSSSVSYEKYPINNFQNFQLFSKLFEKYYPSFEKLDSDNFHKMSTFRKQVLQTIFSLWLSGYGIIPGFTCKHIDDELLDYLINYNSTRLSKISRFIGYMLSNENSSHVLKIPRIKKTTDVVTRERNKWDSITGKYSTQITDILYNFTFSVLLGRVGDSLIVEYDNEEGQVVRESSNPLKYGTWVNYSLSLYKLAELLNLRGHTTIEVAISSGINDVMTSYVSKLPSNTKSSIRVACKHWLLWYSKTNSIKINVTRIVPQSIRNKEKSFGKIINLNAAYVLIKTLLDEKCSFFNDAVVSDFRARRACLIQLASGARSSEICILFKNCLKDDNMGTPWLYFHKTKNNNENKVVATPDILEWVKELQKVAPSHKILISTKDYPDGDDLEEYRLFANMYDEGPLTNESMNKFLIRIQHKIWPGVHPNKKPFQTHDFRRMHSLYMKLKGATKEEIQNQLGHEDISSQIPYLATKPVSHQRWFKEIYSEGVYKKTDPDTNSDDIDISNVINKSIDLKTDKYDYNKIIALIESVSSDIDKFELPKSTLLTKLLPTGFPLRTHNCNANSMTNCGYTELHCFGCEEYKPDEDKYEDHKIEIFRYMLLMLYQGKLAKKSRDLLETQVIQLQSNNLNRLIQRALNEVFTKLGMEKDGIVNIEYELFRKAKKFMQKYYLLNPNPSFDEASKYLAEGTLNGE